MEQDFSKPSGLGELDQENWTHCLDSGWHSSITGTSNTRKGVLRQTPELKGQDCAFSSWSYGKESK